jgi:hypothetical protein
LKPEQWSAPLVQEEKYQGERKLVIRDHDDDDDNIKLLAFHNT